MQNVFTVQLVLSFAVRILYHDVDGVADVMGLRRACATVTKRHQIHVSACFAFYMSMTWTGGKHAQLIKRCSMCTHPEHLLTCVDVCCTGCIMKRYGVARRLLLDLANVAHVEISVSC